MRFAEMLTFWALNSQIKSEMTLCADKISGEQDYHILRFLVVDNRSFRAKITYRCKGASTGKGHDMDFKMINTDIFFADTVLGREELYMAGTTLQKLEEYMF